MWRPVPHCARGTQSCSCSFAVGRSPVLPTFIPFPLRVLRASVVNPLRGLEFEVWCTLFRKKAHDRPTRRILLKAASQRRSLLPLTIFPLGWSSKVTHVWHL
jgi:hypothetical protein